MAAPRCQQFSKNLEELNRKPLAPGKIWLISAKLNLRRDRRSIVTDGCVNRQTMKMRISFEDFCPKKKQEMKKWELEPGGYRAPCHTSSSSTAKSRYWTEEMEMNMFIAESPGHYNSYPRSTFFLIVVWKLSVWLKGLGIAFAKELGWFMGLYRRLLSLFILLNTHKFRAPCNFDYA